MIFDVQLHVGYNCAAVLNYSELVNINNAPISIEIFTLEF